MKVSQRGEVSTIVAIAAITILSVSALITSFLIKDKFSIRPFATTDPCIEGIQYVKIKKDGVYLNNGDVINDANNLECEARVTNVDRADKFLVCAFKINGAWPLDKCPSESGDYIQIYHDNQTLRDVTTIFTKCSQTLPNLSAIQSLQAVAARFTTNNQLQCRWDNPNQFVSGPTFYYQQTPLDPTNTTIPTNSITTPSPTSLPITTSTVNPTPAACSGNSCTDCIINKGPSNLLEFYQQNGWDISCSNQTNIVNNWCTTVNPDHCLIIKSAVCASACNFPTTTLIPIITPVTTVPPSTATPNPSSQPTSRATQTPTTTITPQPAKVPGDANNDGCVNLLDFEILRREFGQNRTGLLVDFNNDNWVNLLDFSILLINFGRCR